MEYLVKLGMYRRAMGYFLILFPTMTETDLCYLAELAVMYYDNPDRFK